MCQMFYFQNFVQIEVLEVRKRKMKHDGMLKSTGRECELFSFWPKKWPILKILTQYQKNRHATCFRSTLTISQTIFQVNLATFDAKFWMFTTPYLFQKWLYVLRQSSFGDSKGWSFDKCSHFQFVPNIRKNSCVISFYFFFYSHVVRIITFEISFNF